jgi:hypothetical protein
MTPEDAYLCTPRDWQLSAQQRALDCLGTADGVAMLVESKRYGLCANVIEAQARRIAELEAQNSQMSAAINVQGDRNDK